MQVTAVLVPAAEVGTLARRAAVAAHVIGVHCPIACGEVGADAGIQAAMVSESVEIDQGRPGPAGWKPGLVVECQPIPAGKSAGPVLSALGSSMAHGLTLTHGPLLDKGKVPVEHSRRIMVRTASVYSKRSVTAAKGLFCFSIPPSMRSPSRAG